MNAYELADELEGWSDDWLSSGNKKNVFKKHAKMLRQQADRIERKQELIREQTALLVKQNNRIAELSKNVDELEEELLKAPQIKELSDEEINEVINRTAWVGTEEEIRVKIVKEALKKASEK